MRRLALIGLALAPAGAAAQDSCLSLQDAMAAAAEVSVGARVSEAEAAEVLAQRDAVRAATRPQLSAFTQSGIGDNGLVGGRVENQFGLRATQRLYDFGKTGLAATSLEARAAAADARAAQARDEDVFAVARAWLTVRAGEAQAAAARAERADLTALVASLERLSAKGDATLAELTAAKTQAADADARLSGIALEVRGAELELARLSRSDAGACEGTELPVPPPPPGEDIAGHPALAAARAEAAAADADRRLERRSRLPDVDLVGTAAYGYDGFTDEWGPRERIGLNVAVPLYTSGQQSARYRGAAARLARAEAQLDLVRRGLAEEAAMSRAAYAALGAQADARERAADAKREQHALMRTAYDRGFAALPELIEVRAELTERQIGAIAARRDHALEGVRLTLLSGAAPER